MCKFPWELGLYTDTLLWLQENPVGTGTGKYKDIQLFRAAQNHASLIPILGLIKYNEFYGIAPALPKKSESCSTCCYYVAYHISLTQEK